MLKYLKLQRLLSGLFCFLATAPLALAGMNASQRGGIVTITDTGSNPNSTFTVSINANNSLVVQTSGDNFFSTITRTFNASTVEQVRIFTGAGIDQVVLRTAINQGGVEVVQSFPNIDFQIQTGAGDDRVFSVVADIGDLSVSTGTGNDLVSISTGTVINGDLLVETGRGNDDVFFQTIDVRRTTSVFTGSGSDRFETFRSLFFRRVDIDVGPNADQISIGGPAPFSNRRNFFLAALRLSGGTGNDLINVDNGDYPFVVIDGGTGLDCYVPYGTFQFDVGFRLSNINTCPPAFPFGSQHIYKKVANRELEMTLVKPDDWEPSDRRPVILYFHGGSWITGSPLQLIDHSQYFATQGVVGVMVQYRLLDRDIRDEPPVICINDAKSAMRFVRSNADQLGIDPNRIASCGASAGGHLAAFLGTTDGIDDPQDDLSVSARANAMCLFAPAYDNGPRGFGRTRVGDRFLELSPAHNISSDDAPHIVFSGTDDTVISTDTIRWFRQNMLEAGVRSDFRLYDGADHAFFLQRFDDGIFYTQSLAAMHRFLESLGWVQGPPSFADF